MNVCMVGTGYVGLVTGACFASRGHGVVCVDVDRPTIEKLRRGIMPIYEPGLDDIVRREVDAGRLSFTRSLADSLRGAEVCFLAVGTPSGEEGGTELKYVYSAADEIGSALDHDCLVVVKSTVPVGTCETVLSAISAKLRERGCGAKVEVASNPEFLKEGSALDDFLNPARVIVGASSKHAADVMTELYSSFIDREKIMIMDIASAEITQYACNAMLAMKISFINEIALLCDVAGGDIANVKRGMATDPRIGGSFLRAGCGYGGSCFPKDIEALDQTGRVLGLEMKMAGATSLVNERQKRVLGNMIAERFGKNLNSFRIAVLGLAFKPNTDDMRRAPAMPLISMLARLGAEVAVTDPAALGKARGMLPARVTYAKNALEALEGADAAVLVTEWDEFKNLDWAECGKVMRRKIVFDGRNVYEPETMAALGFEYYCIGRSRTVRTTHL